MQYHSRCIRRDIKALLLDGLPHDGSELWAIIYAHGGGHRQLRSAVQDLRDGGFYVAYDRAVGSYHWVTNYADTDHATADALAVRAIPELIHRIKAHRGEWLRAVHHRGETGFEEADNIARYEASLTGMAVGAGMSPARLIAATYLSTDDEASILVEVPVP
jgi:hypothetical protein